MPAYNSDHYCAFCGNLHCPDHSQELQQEIRDRHYEALSAGDKALIRQRRERNEKAIQLLREAGYRVSED